MTINYDESKKYLIEFDTQVGERGEYNLRIIGVLHGKFGDDDCPSGKVWSVSYVDPLLGVYESIWVSSEDNPKLIEISEESHEYYEIMIGGDCD